MFWDKEKETITREDLKKLQSERLREILKRAGESPFYKKKFSDEGIDISSIKSVDDITKLPFTQKQDLRDWFPYGFLTVDRRELVRLHASSGTTGKSTAVFYTRRDIDTWAEMVARCMVMVGMTDSDVFQNMTGYGMFTGGLGMHFGAEKVGAIAIPMGAGNTKWQIANMKAYGTTVIHATPSYALHLCEVFEEEGIDPVNDLALRIGLIGAEPHSDATRKKIEDMMGIRAFNSYGLSEMNGPGVAFECEEQSGMHLWEDNYVLEIIDPVTGEPLPDGERGELVLTTLNRDGMPLIRYRTRDLTSVIPGECPCGRTHRRINRITGRSDDMLIIKGVNVFPSQIEDVLMSMPEVGNNYQIELTRVEGADHIIVNVEVDDSFFRGDITGLNALRRKIQGDIRSETLVTPEVKLVEPNTLPRSIGKAVRVVDKREI
ncbi:MAG TPA: phenylacetate--CoA ligase [bacterium]|nr:phenylacetate--CoA ligase [bacterium]